MSGSAGGVCRVRAGGGASTHHVGAGGCGAPARPIRIHACADDGCRAGVNGHVTWAGARVHAGGAR